MAYQDHQRLSAILDPPQIALLCDIFKAQRNAPGLTEVSDCLLGKMLYGQAMLRLGGSLTFTKEAIQAGTDYYKVTGEWPAWGPECKPYSNHRKSVRIDLPPSHVRRLTPGER